MEGVTHYQVYRATSEDGKYTKTPVKSSYGYFVIQRVSQDEKPSLEDSKDECLDAIYEKKVSEDANLNGKAWIEIRKSYNLNIVDSEVSKSYQKTVKTLNKTSATKDTTNSTILAINKVLNFKLKADIIFESYILHIAPIIPGTIVDDKITVFSTSFLLKTLYTNGTNTNNT